jgi:cysteine-rich repeat protein
MHCSSSIPCLLRTPGLAAAVLVTGCFNPEPGELTTTTTTTNSSSSTTDGSTSTPPLETSTGPGATSMQEDDTTTSTPDGTTTTSTPDDTTTDATTGEPVCGDGVLDDGEDCDDMGESATCDADCTLAECGDMLVNRAALEGCDDGNPDDNDECAMCQAATCGDGFVWVGNEDCDDANANDDDACTSACALGGIRVAGYSSVYLANALTALGEAFTGEDTEWPTPGSDGVLIVGHDGASPDAPDYQPHFDAGGHLLLVGGSGDPAYAAWANGFFAASDDGSWHQSNTCAADWNTVGAHPMTASMPANWEFTDQSLSYHMIHFEAAGQSPDTELLGQSCEAGPDNYVLATRRFASGGTFTYLALDVGQYSDAASEAGFVAPFLQGYLDYVRNGAP